MILRNFNSFPLKEEQLKLMDNLSENTPMADALRK